MNPAEMSDEEYKAALYKLRLPIANERLGTSSRSSQRFAAGITSVPGPLAILMRLMISRGITVEELEKLE